MTHCFGRPKGLQGLVRFAEKLWEEFVFEVLQGLDFPRQPNTGLGTIKQRHPEKAGTIIRVSSESHGCRWFHWSAVAVFVQIFVWKGRTPNPHKKICLLMLVTGLPLRIEFDQVCRTYSQKTCAWAMRINIQMS